MRKIVRNAVALVVVAALGIGITATAATAKGHPGGCHKHPELC